MAMFVSGGTDAFDAMRGGRLDERSRGTLSQMYQSARDMLSEGQRAFVEQAQNAYQMISDSNAALLLRNLGSKITGVWEDKIHPLYSIEEMQTASPQMQRWIMANVVVRQHYLDQQCEGYGDAYTNYHGEQLGELHFDWRRVMDGVMVTPTEGDAYYRIYHDTMTENERTLTAQERTDILDVWRRLEVMFDEEGEDPTSQYGASL